MEVEAADSHFDIIPDTRNTEYGAKPASPPFGTGIRLTVLWYHDMPLQMAMAPVPLGMLLSRAWLRFAYPGIVLHAK